MNEAIKKRLEILISKQFSDGLNKAEANEFNCILQSSTEARRLYIKQCQIHAMLLEETDLLQTIAEADLGEKVVSMFEDDAENAAATGGNSSRRPVAWVGWVVASVASFVLLLGGLFLILNEEEPAPVYVSNGNLFDQQVQDRNPIEEYMKSVNSLPDSGSLDRPVATSVPHKDSTIRFNRDIRPILSDNCFHCHGPDKATRAADLRLDTHDGMLADLGDGRRAVIPGDPKNSELYKRIITKEQDEIMPPPTSHKHLKQEDIRLLKQWIAMGAPWEDHWSFTDIKRPEVPQVSDDSFVANPIDAFIVRRLDQAGLQPAKEADRRTLIRRVSFDLRGLPPTEQEIDSFVNDESPNAYEQMVDQFLASSQYGEHRARYWLDAARYSDTHGLHLDNYRSIWPYRDWVVDAFNANMPFDQFTVEQIAGDLLPEPSQSQLIATGFNRCNPTTSEGGAIGDEYRAIYALDRVETTSTVWLGLTMSCASCHDHKFDPLSQKDFYQMTAFFRNTTQAPMDRNVLDTPPSIRVYEEDALLRKKVLEGQMWKLEKALKEYVGPSLPIESENHWLASDDLLVRVDATEEGIVVSGSAAAEPEIFEAAIEETAGLGAITIAKDTSVELGDYGQLAVNKPFTVSFWVYHPELDEGAKLPEYSLFGKFDPETGQGWSVRTTSASEVTLSIKGDGKPVWSHQLNLTTREKLKPGAWNHVLLTVSGDDPKVDGIVNVGSVVSGSINEKSTALKGGGLRMFFKTMNISVDQPLMIGSPNPNDKIADDAPTMAIRDVRLFDHILSRPEQIVLSRTFPSTEIAIADRETELAAIDDAAIEKLNALRVARQEMQDMKARANITLVMKEKKDSVPKARILNRGLYDQPGDEVLADVPEALLNLPEGEVANRLSLANWLVDPKNPLPARVTVNRFWQELFGTGIVKTSEDFGSQGEPPSHLELLDWLAAEFIESDWDIKHMYKLMLMSSTYRQSSAITPEKLEADPENRLLARGPRFRLDAEVIRDQALQVGQLLVDDIGGPPVKPYQPMGIWNAVGYTNSNTANYSVDDGESLYRRSLYTFWKRTAPPPSMVVFDAPSRETCSVRRERTNTPLQALVLMNDPQYVEAARNLAEFVLTSGQPDKFTMLYEVAMGYEPEEAVVDVLKNTYQSVLPIYIEDQEAAKKLIQVGNTPADGGVDPAELAAWTIVANQIMNLDSFITKN
ncbi:MAG: DUF1553 domain-containing protein [Verrucomicrobiota bacterium]